MIDVKRGNADSFAVTIREGREETHHVVILQEADRARLGGSRSGEAIVEAAFRFLLEREPMEAILSRFDLTLIAHYFPEFERELPNYL